ncbi:hypothetical protein PG985_002366 [Apiospora marii]|uniref:uncharacterized protein n=1 Tax=Apiospora marii TaxID=335849 RepID=UPI003131B701
MADLSAALESFTAIVAEKAAAVSDYLDAESLPKPTLGEAGHVGYQGESTALRKARYDLARAAKSLQLLAQGPEDTALALFRSAFDASNIEVLLRFRFFDAVPLGATAQDERGISTADLAAKVDLPLGLTERIVRFAVGNGLFEEPAPGLIIHSATSAALARSPALRAVGRLTTGPITDVTVRIADALELQQAGRNGVTKSLLTGQSELGQEEPAFCLAFPPYKSPWELAQANPDFAGMMGDYMRHNESTSRMRLDHLVQARDWSSLGAARVVDVGGSLGHASIALASAMPSATFLVQDVTAATVEEGRALVQQQFPDLAPRIAHAQHDFFTPMPAEAAGADVYLLQWILHDWTDADAVRILRGLVPALSKPGARVLISEAVRPETPARLANTLDEKVVMDQDVIMLAAHASKERSVAGFTRLFEEADARFHHVATGGGANGALRSVLEYELRD